MPEKGYADTQAAMPAPGRHRSDRRPGLQDRALHGGPLRRLRDFLRPRFQAQPGAGLRALRPRRRRRETGRAGPVRPTMPDRTTKTSSPTTTFTISGLVYAPAVGIWVLQSGRNQIVHNHIHDLFYTAIQRGLDVGLRGEPVQGQHHRVQPPARYRQGDAQRHGRHLHARRCSPARASATT